MKETRYFYAPDVATSCELPAEEAAHVVRVLRLTTGDEINLTDGVGHFYQARITTATQKRCMFEIIKQQDVPSPWHGSIHLAMAPTKNMDRIEWFAEKATEIGFDELSFLDCRFSERKVVKTERIDKILVSAMKQSHKSFKPRLNEMCSFKQFVSTPFTGQKFIAHCYDMPSKPHLQQVLSSNESALVMIGPEGDFSIDEVNLAKEYGFVSISLGDSRLRTETAALVAVHLMQLAHSTPIEK